MAGDGLSSLYLALKLLGVALTAGFGMLGLLVNFKDKDGKITKWGRRALIGSVCSFGATLATELIQNAKNNRRAVIERQQQFEISQNILRGVYPLRPVRLAVRYSYPLDVVATSNYPRRVRQYFLSSRDRACQDLIMEDGIHSTRCQDGVLGELWFSKEFHLWPTLREIEFRQLLARTRVDIGFFVPGYGSKQRKPTASAFYARSFGSSKVNPLFAADLHIFAYREESVINIAIRSVDQEIRAVKAFHTDSIPVERFDLSGSVVSTIDLLGTAMVLTIGTDLGADTETMRRFKALRGAVELEEVRFLMDGLGEFCFAGVRFTKSTDADGLPHFETVFPRSLEDLRKDSILSPTAQCINDDNS